jgi:hypothetical protein
MSQSNELSPPDQAPAYVPRPHEPRPRLGKVHPLWPTLARTIGLGGITGPSNNFLGVAVISELTSIPVRNVSKLSTFYPCEHQLHRRAHALFPGDTWIPKTVAAASDRGRLTKPSGVRCSRCPGETQASNSRYAVSCTDSVCGTEFTCVLYQEPLISH